MLKSLIVAAILGFGLGFLKTYPPAGILILMLLGAWVLNEIKKNREEVYSFFREDWRVLRQLLPLLIFDFAIGAIVWLLDLVTGTYIASIIYIIIYMVVPVAFFAIFMARLFWQRR